MNYIRSSGFWNISCNAAMRYYISKCVTCRHLRGNFQLQKMTSLPSDRLCEEPSFTYCGVDLFGPFVIKQGCKELRRYGALFTCLSSRVIHIETVASINTDSFILCLRRFIGRRGNIRFLRSDNSINFVGAFSEFKKSFTEVDQQKIKEANKKCKTYFELFIENPWH